MVFPQKIEGPVPVANRKRLRYWALSIFTSLAQPALSTCTANTPNALPPTSQIQTITCRWLPMKQIQQGENE
jgi:hypothetical protein